jgi:hypothetical protein
LGVRHTDREIETLRFLISPEAEEADDQSLRKSIRSITCFPLRWVAWQLLDALREKRSGLTMATLLAGLLQEIADREPSLAVVSRVIWPSSKAHGACRTSNPESLYHQLFQEHRLCKSMLRLARQADPSEYPDGIMGILGNPVLRFFRVLKQRKCSKNEETKQYANLAHCSTLMRSLDGHQTASSPVEVDS